jgi:hypothetical protein
MHHLTILCALLAMACSGSTTEEGEIRIGEAPPVEGAAPAPAPMSPRAHVVPPGGRSASDDSVAATKLPYEGVDITDVRVVEEVLAESAPLLASATVQCDPVFGSPLGGIWYVFDDHDCDKGSSLSLLQLLHNGNDGLGCTLRWLGSVNGPFNGRFAGVGVDLEEAGLGKYTKLILETRGDGRLYRAQFPLQEQLRRLDEASRQEDGDRCAPDLHDYYGQRFFCGDGSSAWSRVEIRLDRLTQVGSGAVMALDLSLVERLQLVTVTRGQHTFQCEFRVVGLE